MKLLHVIKTSKKEVREKWDLPLSHAWPETLYVRCNAKGEINWEVAPVYTAEELVDRGDYKLLKHS